MLKIFDHGVDSIVTSLTSIATITILTRINQSLSPIYSILIMLTSFIGFHSPTYEHVVTRKMRFQPGPCNPTEALLLMQFLYLIKSIYPSIWSGEKAEIPLMIIIILSSLSSIFSFLSSMKQIYLYYQRNLSLTIKSLFRGYSPLFFIMICSLICFSRISPFYKEHSLICLLSITIPWNYSIYRTIIIEITNDQNFDTYGVLLGQSPILIPIISMLFSPSLIYSSMILSIIISGMIYICTFYLTLNEVCHALSMKHFWTVKQDSQTSQLIH